MSSFSLSFVLLTALLVPGCAESVAGAPAAILKPDLLRSYVAGFNRNDHTDVSTTIPNEVAADWMAENVPFFECPDPAIQEIYHFRWWTYRKHIERAPDGYVITEFLPKVSWSAKYNTIS